MTLVQRVREPAGGAEPPGSLVLLHGRGADEHDLHPLLDLLDPRRRLLGVTPGGPLHLPPGGRHWYVVPRVGFPDPDTFRASLAELQALVADLPRPLVLGGFSQGTVMSYALLGAGVRPAALIALSGFVPTVDGWSLPEDLSGLEVAIGHGTRDPVISVEFARGLQAGARPCATRRRRWATRSTRASWPRCRTSSCPPRAERASERGAPGRSARV